MSNCTAVLWSISFESFLANPFVLTPLYFLLILYLFSSHHFSTALLSASVLTLFIVHITDQLTFSLSYFLLHLLLSYSDEISAEAQSFSILKTIVLVSNPPTLNLQLLYPPFIFSSTHDVPPTTPLCFHQCFSPPFTSSHP